MWTLQLAESLDMSVDALIELTEMLLEPVAATDDLAARRARRVIDEHVELLASVSARLWAGAPRGEHPEQD